MTLYSGKLHKMSVAVDSNNVAQYGLNLGDQAIDINALIGKSINLSFDNEIRCTHCNAKTKKSFNQGYCYRCLITLAQCDSCIIKPELCHYNEGTCREPEWGETHCLSDHFVYISNTGNLKVGITRHVTDGVSSRWIDQGATQAIAMLRVPDRLTSGKVEMLCKQHIGDKTNWRTMLKGVITEQDLVAKRDELLDLIQPELEALAQEKGIQAFTRLDTPAIDIAYPVEQYPEKIKSINLDKTPEFDGVLQGIKGQYWLLDGDRVINIRKYAGYHVEISVA